MSNRSIYFNGEFIPEAEARISIFDCALMYGDMVFDVTRSFNQKPFRLENHLDRLYASMRYAEIDCGLTIDEMEAVTYETIDRNLPVLDGMDFQILHDVTRGVLPYYGGVVREGTRSVLAISVFPLLRHLEQFAETYETGSHFVITPQQSVPARYIDPKVKNRSRIFYKLAELQAAHMEKGASALLTDERGFITEGPGCNFFIARDGVVYTPKPHDILRGVSRSVCMKLATGMGIAVEEADIEPYDVRGADEAWWTGTLTCMVPITRFNFHPISDGKPGPIYRKLLAAWCDEVGLDIVAQAREYAKIAKTWKP